MLAEVGLTLFFVLTAVSAMTVQVPQSQIEVGRGDDLQLKCQYTTNMAERIGLNVEWYLLPDDPDGELTDVVQYFFGGVYKAGKLYTARANFSGDVEKDDCSITIKNTRMTDSGSYEVEVKMPFDLEGDRKDRIEVTVLVPPSKPVCEIEGKAEFGQTVKLTCHSKEGSPKPTYSWQSFNTLQQPRALPHMSSQESDGLILKNLSADTSGFFICTSRNKIKAVTCNITLAVTPPSMNIGFYAGIIGGAIAAIIILGIIVYCCCCRDNGKAPENYEMEDPQHRRAYTEEDENEELTERDPKKREYRDGYYDEVPHENDGENTPRSTVRVPLAPPNKPKNVPEDHDA
ncbi:cell surface A33 antigen-like [Heterodontus francisci]|uniref:cell surface A33 antigen-like n=1 Tax=Heterodontus francisci TaxID=7792 RepID=UPI00355BD82B